MDKELQVSNWDPFAELDLSIPVRIKSAFNSGTVKKAYRKLARKYHPDKAMELPEGEREEAGKKWLKIAKAYETLTDEEKFNNWLSYGRPEGPLSSDAFDMEFALPSWMLQPKNQLYMLCGMFTLIVFVPLVAIARAGDMVGEEQDLVNSLERGEYRYVKKEYEKQERKRLRDEAFNSPAAIAQREKDDQEREA
jgi:curved DNA-binding protein CbpA